MPSILCVKGTERVKSTGYVKGTGEILFYEPKCLEYAFK
jgi:hypothetical protein